MPVNGSFSGGEQLPERINPVYTSSRFGAYAAVHVAFFRIKTGHRSNKQAGTKRIFVRENKAFSLQTIMKTADWEGWNNNSHSWQVL
ncbi:hypothetical protein EOPP23_10060 [Endozoicomonas sp. OPT23]|nr:hypothetical protein [Endozoicomonas sp. OPT23]